MACNKPIVLRANRILPMDSAPIEAGAIVIESGHIIDIGIDRQVLGKYSSAAIHDYGKATLLPGLVNAHVHLDLSDLDSRDFSGSDFVAWLGQIVQKSAAEPDAQALDATRIGINESLWAGVTTVGDIARFPAVTRRLLRQSPLRAISYGEVRAMAARRHLLTERVAAATDMSLETGRLRIGVSPHAPYSIEPAGYRQALALAREQDRPLTTHLSESPHETRFLKEHAGPLRELWNRIGGWDDLVPTFAGGPIRYARELGLLDYPCSLAHVNYASDEELDILAAGHASIVYCPRTHAFFNHPPHRWRQMLTRRINVAVGTDSRASAPDLDLLNELRFLHRLDPQASPSLLLELATTRAARALNLEQQVGSLAIGKRADVAVFPVHGEDPLTEILETEVSPCALWIDGEPVTIPSA